MAGRATASCAECRRRRIRCEGLTTPCHQCVYYQVPHLCHYPPRKQRRNVSWRSHSELSEAHAKAQRVLDTLFPSCSLDELCSMSRVALLSKAQALAQSEKSTNELQDLEPPPERDFTWDEVSDGGESERVADDINGMADSLDSLNSFNASYVGFSSVPTILRVIAHLSPRIRQVVPPNPETLKAPVALSASPGSTMSSDLDELSLINAYFFHVHPVTPMIDEVDFRQRFSNGVSKYPSNSWLALFNMVLAMGSFASDTELFNKNNVLYKRALSYLSLASLGSGNLYTVQALALYGGYILHYLNKPNTASAIMGATIRMAVAMGLHRAQMPEHTSPDAVQHAARSSIMTRIRTWWSIFCLDTWAAATLGRPGLGYWNPATVLTSPMSSLASLDYGTISLAASEQFCKIATRIQERLVQVPLITPDEIAEFDRELLEFQSSLHMFLANRDHCPPNLRVARSLLRCRFITTRLTLYRPYLLSTALHRKSWADTSQQGQTANTPAWKCVQIAREALDVISLDWFPNHIIAWNHAWHLFQVSLVLVLAAVSDRTGVEQGRCDEDITKALVLLTQMEPFNAGAMRGRRIIRILYDNIRNPQESDAVDFDAVGSSVLDFLDLDLLGNDTDWLGLLCDYNENS
ncbi:fungal specific transcription factor domain-containing protein [Aspergillus lucknowensis]|uniref:Fungal-specific transcription factor domain-containing protein n=1 Tax=Aspergillus lucknowensis TaxID=176173 RepID=A0ABR4LD59_9EURO